MVPFRVAPLRKIKKSETGIPNLPGIYKWWCDKETLACFFEQINSLDFLTGNVTKLTFLSLVSQMEHCYFSEYDKELFCFYVGKADAHHGLRDRIISNHVKGNANGSTLRKTIYSLKYGVYDSHNLENKNNDKSYVNGKIDKLFIEWQDYPVDQVDSYEIAEINRYLRIFNIDSGDLKDSHYPFDVEYRHNLLSNLTFARNKLKI